MNKTLLVVLSHNGKSVSEKFLSHFENFTSPDLVSLLWIENGSSDDTRSFIGDKKEALDSKYQFDVIYCEENKGVIGGRNIGFDVFLKKINIDFSINECDKIMFLDNDQYVSEGWLEQHIAVLDRGYDIIGVEAWQMTTSFMPVKRCTKRTEWFSYVGCGGMLMKRTTVEQVGQFDPIFNPSYFEDPDYCMRCFEKGLKIGWNCTAKITHVPHQTLGSAPDRMQRFTKSSKLFRDKWRGRQSLRLVQYHLPEFDM